MSRPDADRSADRSADCAPLRKLLRDVEARLKRRADGAELDARMAELERLVAEDTAAADALAERLRRVRALHALRAREVPDGALDGLYDAVRAGVARSDGDRAGRAADDWVRAGMSQGFLDAPRALAVWRRTAVAACALVAAGIGGLTTGLVPLGAPADATGPVREAGFDPRDELLEPLQPVAGSSSASPAPGAVRSDAIRQMGAGLGPAGAAPRVWRGTPSGRRPGGAFSFSIRIGPGSTGGRFDARQMEASRMLDAVPVAVPIRAAPAPDEVERN